MTCDRFMDLELEPDLVNPADGCPDCGERRVDFLVWVDDVTVECQSCGELYDPAQTPDSLEFILTAPAAEPIGC